MPRQTAWKDTALCALPKHIFFLPFLLLMDLCGVWAWMQSYLVCVKSCCREVVCNTHETAPLISLYVPEITLILCLHVLPAKLKTITKYAAEEKMFWNMETRSDRTLCASWLQLQMKHTDTFNIEMFLQWLFTLSEAFVMYFFLKLIQKVQQFSYFYLI